MELLLLTRFGFLLLPTYLKKTKKRFFSHEEEIVAITGYSAHISGMQSKPRKTFDIVHELKGSTWKKLMHFRTKTHNDSTTSPLSLKLAVHQTNGRTIRVQWEKVKNPFFLREITITQITS